MAEEIFHDVGNLFPGEVEVVSVPPRMAVGDALQLMRERRFSQLPVVENGEVLGVFSLWSLAENLALFPQSKVQSMLQEMEVQELMEQLPRVTVKDSIHSILSRLERHDALLVDSPRGLQAIATPSDVLRYFYRVARPFILLQEIELALRSLIEICAPDDKLQTCIERALSKTYQGRGRTLPTNLLEMTFEEYRTIITCVDNWPMFEGTLGHNRDLISAKLERLRIIRNEVFHFRSEITVLDYQHLATAREEFLGKLRRAVSRKEGVDV
jgi:CBS domain-containing protein